MEELLLRMAIGFITLVILLYFTLCITLTFFKAPGEEGYDEELKTLQIHRDAPDLIIISRRLGFTLRWVMAILLFLSFSYIIGGIWS